MSLKSVPPQSLNKATNNLLSKPDYAGLVQFLVQPFLESPNSLSVDCEIPNASRVWIRIAFEGEDKGRVFGRGGRNIQAIRTAIAAAAEIAGQSVYLDIYGSGGASRDSVSDSSESDSPSGNQLPPRRDSLPKPSVKLRSNLN